MPPISPIMTTAVGVGVVVEQLQRLALRRADDRVAADADACRLADAEARQLVDRLVDERAGARDDADVARAEHVARHDADAALAGRDHARAVRADEDRLLPCRFASRAPCRWSGCPR